MLQDSRTGLPLPPSPADEGQAREAKGGEDERGGLGHRGVKRDRQGIAGEFDDG